MCKMCEEKQGEMESCQYCGRLICFDEPSGSGDDVITRAYVTESGDLFCERCGRKYDREQEEQDERDSIGLDFGEI